MKRFHPKLWIAQAFLLSLLFASSALAGELRITFIGNEAFHITDGETTLLTDFPYMSGAYEYMTFDADAVPPVTDGLSLITHFHGDHFDPEAFAPTGFHIVAPSSITNQLDVGDRVIPLAAPVTTNAATPWTVPDFVAEYKGIRIEAFNTPHRLAPDHFSYLVTWHGNRLYFVGDTATPGFILPLKNIDVTFITPWLVRTISRQNLILNSDHLVLYHHRTGEDVPPFQDYLRLDQTASFTIPFADVDAGVDPDDSHVAQPSPQRGFAVVLDAVGPDPKKLIRALRSLRPDLDRKEAPALVESLPVVLSAGLPSARAAKALAGIQASGAAAHLH